VNPFVWSDSSQSVLSRLITNRLVVDLKRAKDFDVVERTQLSADANHGEVTATDLVLLGGVIKLESSMTVTARLVTTADQQIVAGVHITVPRTPGLLFLSQ
jgi:TolB-like protein